MSVIGCKSELIVRFAAHEWHAKGEAGKLPCLRV